MMMALSNGHGYPSTSTAAVSGLRRGLATNLVKPQGANFVILPRRPLGPCPAMIATSLEPVAAPTGRPGDVATLSHSTVITAMVRVYSEGGLRSVWRSNVANLAKTSPDSAIKFFCFDGLIHHFFAGKSAPSFSERLLMGFAAGSVAHVCLFPLEAIKAHRMVAVAGMDASHVPRVHEVVYKMTASGGIKSLYKGFPSTIAGAVPYAAVDIAVFSWLKDQWSRSGSADGASGPGLPALIALGMISTAVAHTATSPFVRAGNVMLSPGVLDMLIHGEAMRSTAIRTALAVRDSMRAISRGFWRIYLPSLPCVAISLLMFEFSQRAGGYLTNAPQLACP